MIALEILRLEKTTSAKQPAINILNEQTYGFEMAYSTCFCFPWRTFFVNETASSEEPLHYPTSGERIELLVSLALPTKNISKPNLYKPKGKTIIMPVTFAEVQN